MNTTTALHQAPGSPAPPYPVHVDGELDTRLSRGLWLVKWLLAIPHYVVLAFLWLGFAVTTLLAFFSILATGRYPRALFEFNVGVMRWSWRVSFYAYGALGTDRYPPFTLAEVPEYPAHLHVDYPEHLSRGLALVKWWLLAIPHYLVLALFVGGVGYGIRSANDDPVVAFSLIGALVLVAGVVLLFTGRYPPRVFDLLLGLNRWVLRVAGYVSLMTDRYPPFSLDQGGPDPDSPPAGSPTVAGQAGPVHAGTVPPAGWTTRRVASVITGSLVVLMGLGLAGVGVTTAVTGAMLRDHDGFLTTPATTFTSDTFAITSGELPVQTHGASGWVPERVLGDVRLTAGSPGGTPIFLGLARTGDVADYLAGVRHAEVRDLRHGSPVYEQVSGRRPTSLPADADIWAVSATGERPRITWTPTDGDWTVVLMSADGSAPVEARIQAGAEVPALDAVVAVTLLLGVLLLLLGTALVAIPVTGAVRTSAVASG